MLFFQMKLKICIVMKHILRLNRNSYVVINIIIRVYRYVWKIKLVCYVQNINDKPVEVGVRWVERFLVRKYMRRLYYIRIIII